MGFIEDGIVNGSALPVKEDARALAGLAAAQASKYIRAQDWNQIRQALLDIRTGIIDGVGGASDAVYVSATGDGTTDDRAAIQTSIDTAIADGKALHFPPGTYKIGRALDINNATGFRISASAFASIVFPSDGALDGSLQAYTAGMANPNQAIRSAFVLRNSSNVTIEGLTFQGGTSQQVYDVNIGCPIYAATTNTGLRFMSCDVFDGYAPLLHEQNGFARGNMTMLNVRSFNCRAPVVPCKGFLISDCDFYRPMTMDYTGKANRFVVNSATSVTVHCARGSFPSTVVGKYVYITNSPTNDGGPWVITAATARTGTAPATFTFTRLAGSNVTEFGGADTRYFIPNGDKVGIGSSLTKSVNTMTLVSTGTPFVASDVGKAIRIVDKGNVANCVAAVVLTVPSSNTLTFTNATGVNVGAWAGAWSIDAYDNVRDNGINYGSSHAIYCTAGRGEGRIEGCSFNGIRGSGVKLSGSTAPIEGILVTGCTFDECASAFLFGADDSQEHTGLKFENNYVRNCGNGRQGWTEQNAFYGFGARNVSIKNNTIIYTHDDISSVDGHSGPASYAIYIGRYRAGLSQPVENVDIVGNQITADALETTAANVAQGAIHVDSCGTLPRYAHTGTLTFFADPTLAHDITNAMQLGTNVVMLEDNGAFFCQEIGDGWTIDIIDNPTPGNNVIEKPILRVAGTNRIYFTNATGATSASVGTYRLKPPVGRRGAMCRIANNQIAHTGGVAIQSLRNVGAEITGNIVHGVGTLVEHTGSARIAGNRAVGQTTLSAGIRLNMGTTWPIVHDNTITGHGDHLGVSKALNGEIGIGIDNGTKVDHPLLGVCGKVKPTDGKAEMVIAFGPLEDFVDGDYIIINGTTLTYTSALDATATGKFNTYNDDTGTNRGLVGRINAISGVDAADYGSFFAAPVVTGHIRVRLANPSTTNAGLYMDDVKTCNPTVLVVQRNAIAGGIAYLESRGEQTSGPVETRTVVWSPLVSYSAQINLTANESTAATLLAAGGYYPEKAANDMGCCEVLRHNDTAGTEEFRFTIR